MDIKNKSPFIVLITSLIALFSTSFIPIDNNVNQRDLINASVGELITLESKEANSYTWKILPATTNFKLIDSGQRLIFSSQKEGEYIFICAIANGGQVEIQTFRILVGKVSDVNTVDLNSIVQSWVPKDYKLEDAQRLARSFEEASNNQTSIEELIKLTQVNNRVALNDSMEVWKPFLIEFSTYLQQNYQGKSLEEHVKLWKKVSEILKALE